jgi:hypothetical protein
MDQSILIERSNLSRAQGRPHYRVFEEASARSWMSFVSIMFDCFSLSTVRRGYLHLDYRLALRSGGYSQCALWLNHPTV